MTDTELQGAGGQSAIAPPADLQRKGLGDGQVSGGNNTKDHVGEDPSQGCQTYAATAYGAHEAASVTAFTGLYNDRPGREYTITFQSTATVTIGPELITSAIHSDLLDVQVFNDRYIVAAQEEANETIEAYNSSQEVGLSPSNLLDPAESCGFMMGETIAVQGQSPLRLRLTSGGPLPVFLNIAMSTERFHQELPADMTFSGTFVVEVSEHDGYKVGDEVAGSVAFRPISQTAFQLGDNSVSADYAFEVELVFTPANADDRIVNRTQYFMDNGKIMAFVILPDNEPYLEEVVYFR